VPAVEFLRVNAAVANLIREGRTPQILSAVQAGREEGMVPLERSLADLVRAETVTLSDARAVAGDSKALDEYLGMRR
jgi:twitching motility protein PilT